jgi:hypothetical protein
MGERNPNNETGARISNPGDNPQSSSALPPEAERRRFIKAGLLGAPVVVTLLSRPVLGGIAKAAGSKVSGSSVVKKPK